MLAKKRNDATIHLKYVAAHYFVVPLFMQFYIQKLVTNESFKVKSIMQCCCVREGNKIV